MSAELVGQFDTRRQRRPFPLFFTRFPLFIFSLIYLARNDKWILPTFAVLSIMSHTTDNRRFNGRHLLSCPFRLPQIYEELYHTVNNADHDKDLKWWSFNYGVNMGMNWPQFEVLSLSISNSCCSSSTKLLVPSTISSVQRSE